MNSLLINDLYVFKCPITREFYYEPVIYDGYFFEKEALEKWLNTNNIHPFTGLQIKNKNYYDCVWFNNLLKEFYEKNPEYLNEQYKEKFNEEKVYKLFNENRINDLLKYLTSMKEEIKFTNLNNYKKLLKNENITKHLIDNNISCLNEWDYQLVHFICCYSTSEMIKYIIDKGVDLECTTIDGMRPIHYICLQSTPEMIKYIINKGIDLECEDNDGWRLIHYICRFSTPEMIKYIIDKGVDLECSTKDGWRPIHFICNYSNLDTLSYIVNKGVDCDARINKYSGMQVNYNLIDIINKRFTDETIKQEYFDVLQKNEIYL